ncbi:SLIT-ROBO Rho GTPase-activating protein 1-like isoform X2 [Acanthaster planci]|uniref:SLIT-ROBO Rho GTPase-activating protein 1-like isoform X2 n=1 Tax=Acanthaster planci TaxID=133434 RepID=A0A8B7XN51_ACAPL|nr:SLIT-ROBO Rho GTPase-activating protein 1-like isoform X2 [Acanthaster planci]
MKTLSLQSTRAISEDIRQRLTEQLKCLDNRYDAQREQLGDLQEYMKMRAEVEVEYAKSLEKLHERLTRRQKAVQKDREGGVPSTTACWNMLVDMTRSQYKQHSSFSQCLNYTLYNNFGSIRDGLDNVYKKSREMMVEVHTELLRVMNELYADIKSYHNAHSEEKVQEAKLRQAENEKLKMEEKGSHKRSKTVDKNYDKCSVKHHDSSVKATKARNDYIIAVGAANASMDKFFQTDLDKIVDCLDLRYIQLVRKALKAFHTAEVQVQTLQQDELRRLELCMRRLSSEEDKKLFLQVNFQPFVGPATFQFQSHCGDKIHSLTAQHQLQSDLEHRYELLYRTIAALKIETDEIQKTLKEVERNWTEDESNPSEDEIVTQLRSVRRMVDSVSTPDLNRVSSMKRQRALKQETEMYYLEKQREYLQKSNRLTRMKARQDLIRQGLGLSDSDTEKRCHPATTLQRRQKPRPKSVHNARLFGGNLQEYLEITKRDIPTVVQSCIECISLYGLHHTGIFRMPGSHQEITEMKEAFDKGDDPFENLDELADINLVASVLKLYFRELPEPLFPTTLFPQFMECAKKFRDAERIPELNRLVKELPTSIMIVMRYLFAFLKRLAQYSDENMMDSHNLAVCFGPTLIQQSESDEDILLWQSHINDLIQTMIVFQEDIFPQEPGTLYEDPSITDLSSSPSGSLETIPEGTTDEDANSGFMVTAKADYLAKTSSDLTFSKGDQIRLFNKVDEHWWRGMVGDQKGYIPIQYVDAPENENGVLSHPVKRQVSRTSSADMLVHDIETKMASVAHALSNIETVQNTQASTPDLVKDIRTPVTPSSPGPTTPKPKNPPPAVKPRPSTKPTRPMPSSSRKPQSPMSSTQTL